MKHAAILLLLTAMIGCNNATETKTEDKSKTDTTKTTVAAKPAETPAPPMDSATMMKKMMEYGTPGEMHKMLASSDGKWTTDITMWISPTAPPQKSTGTCENKMVLGGRYQQSMHKSSMGGMPFEGMGTVGYDNSKKMFFSTWIDNMGTGMMMMEGPYDAATKTMNLKGKMRDCTTDKDCDVREVFKIIDDKNQMMEMYSTEPGGKEMKVMELKLTRK
jgi:Protein of unknown function (DUF1579)